VARGDQLGRQWRLIQLLARPQGLAIADASRELGCHVRTLWRDLRDAWGIVRGDLVAVRVVFSAAAAPHVRGRLWHPSQELRELPGGRPELRLRVADTLEVRRWLLGFGAEVEVMEPPALREAVRREAERLVAALAPARKPLARAGGGRRGRRGVASPGSRRNYAD
jgi:predicted DNA-binding transcriptional regulator YafY